MGIGKETIKAGIEEIGKTIRKPEENQTNIETGATKTGSMAKTLIWGIVYAAFVIGVVFLFQRKLLVLKAYCSFLESYGRVFIPLILVVGVGRAFKHSKWSKTE